MLEGKVHVENGRIVVYDQEIFDMFVYVNKTCGKCMRYYAKPPYYTKPPCNACKKLKQGYVAYDKKRQTNIH